MSDSELELAVLNMNKQLSDGNIIEGELVEGSNLPEPGTQL